MANQRHTQTGAVVVYDVPDHIKVTEEQIALVESTSTVSVTQEQAAVSRSAGALHFTEERVAVARAAGAMQFSQEGIIVVWQVLPLTIAGPATYLTATMPLPVFVGAGGSAIANYVWSVDEGSLDFTSGVDTVTWTPPVGAAGFYTISLTDGARTAEAMIFVIGPIVPNSPIEIETRKAVLNDETGVGTRVALRKSKAHRFINVHFDMRARTQFDMVEGLWDIVYPHDTFDWSNADCGIEAQPFYFDSALKSQPVGYNAFNFAFVLKQKNPVTYDVPASNDLPFGPEWAHEVELDKTTLVSDSPSYTRKAKAKSDKRRRFKLGFQFRGLAETLEMEAFWCHHYPGKKINLSIFLTAENLHLNGDFWIVSDFKWRVYVDRIEYEFDILEA